MAVERKTLHGREAIVVIADADGRVSLNDVKTLLSMTTIQDPAAEGEDAEPSCYVCPACRGRRQEAQVEIEAYWEGTDTDRMDMEMCLALDILPGQPLCPACAAAVTQDEIDTIERQYEGQHDTHFVGVHDRCGTELQFLKHFEPEDLVHSCQPMLHVRRRLPGGDEEEIVMPWLRCLVDEAEGVIVHAHVADGPCGRCAHERFEAPNPTGKENAR